MDEMRKRTISALAALVLFFWSLSFYGTWAFACGAAVLSGIAAVELGRAAKAFVRPAYGAATGACAACGVLAMKCGPGAYGLLAGGFVLAMCCFLVLDFETFGFQRMMSCLFGGLVFPVAFWQLCGMSDYKFLVLACACAWGADSGACLVGSAAGRTKLCPRISPGKTVEGLAGGLATAAVLFQAACWVCLAEFPAGTEFHFWRGLCICLPCACASAVGDLAASAVKRECGVKDFGRIMPGHGGVLDRFDSVLFMAPLMTGLLRMCPVFTTEAGMLVP